VSYPNPTLFVGHIGEFFPLLFLEAILATQTNKLDGLGWTHQGFIILFL